MLHILALEGVHEAYKLSMPHILSRWAFWACILGLGLRYDFLHLVLVGLLDLWFLAFG